MSSVSEEDQKQHSSSRYHLEPEEKKFVPAYLKRRDNPTDFQRSIRERLNTWEGEINEAERTDPWWVNPALIALRREQLRQYRVAWLNAVDGCNEDSIIACYLRIKLNLSEGHKTLSWYQSGGWLRSGHNEIESLVTQLLKNQYNHTGTRGTMSYRESVLDMQDYIDSEEQRFERRVPGLSADLAGIRAEMDRKLAERDRQYEQKRTQDKAEADQRYKTLEQRLQQKAQAEAIVAELPAPHSSESSAAAFGSPIHAQRAKHRGAHAEGSDAASQEEPKGKRGPFFNIPLQDSAL